MKLRFVTAIGAVAVLLTVAPGAAQTQTATPTATQTAAEKLEKAIHTEQTAGDLDAAIQMYREIVSSATAPAQKQFAAMAQYRLVTALLQKGDLDSAQRELQNLAFNYSEYKDLIAGMAGRLRGTGRTGAVISLGTFTTGTGVLGHYQNHRTGVEFDIPAGLKMMGDGESSDGGGMVVLEDPGTGANVLIWLKPNDNSTDSMALQLRHDLEVKPSQREPGWKVRPESIVMRTVGGQAALTAIADSTENGIKVAEWVTWVRSPKSHVFFFARTSLNKFPALQAHAEQVIASARIP